MATDAWDVDGRSTSGSGLESPGASTRSRRRSSSSRSAATSRRRPPGGVREACEELAALALSREPTVAGVEARAGRRAGLEPGQRQGLLAGQPSLLLPDGSGAGRSSASSSAGASDSHRLERAVGRAPRARGRSARCRPRPTPRSPAARCRRRSPARRGRRTATSGSAIAAWTSPTLPGQSGKIIATFISTSTSPAAESGRSMRNARIVAQTANSWQIQPAYWKHAASAAGSGLRMIAETLARPDDQPAHAAELLERLPVVQPRADHGDREQHDPDREHDGRCS